MEKFFNFSITTFRNSISSALPYILVYSLTNILISFFIQFPELNEGLESSMGSFDENLFTYLVIIFLLRSIYDISILKLIICKIKKQKVIFNITSMLNYLYKVVLIDVFWIFSGQKRFLQNPDPAQNKTSKLAETSLKIPL